MSLDPQKTPALGTLALHAGQPPDPTPGRGRCQSIAASYVFKSTEHAANLFALEDYGWYRR